MASTSNYLRHVFSYESLTLARGLDVGLPDGWEPEFESYLTYVFQYHVKIPDHNFDYVAGVDVSRIAAYEGLRTTASAAVLSDRPSNINVMADTSVEHILSEGPQAVGVGSASKTCVRTLITSKHACLPDKSELLINRLRQDRSHSISQSLRYTQTAPSLRHLCCWYQNNSWVMVGVSRCFGPFESR